MGNLGTKITTTYRTLLYCALFASLTLNYLVYYGKLDMFGAGVASNASASNDADYLTTLARDDVKPVNLYTKHGKR